MKLDDLTIAQAKELVHMFSFSPSATLDVVASNGPEQPSTTFDNGMIGQYVIVRCRDAGVHAGVLVAHNGRECVLEDAKRLWYWRPKSGKYLSAVANHGLDAASKLGEAVSQIHLTENCEIIRCTAKARMSIVDAEVNT
jgi:hypothetical protein